MKKLCLFLVMVIVLSSVSFACRNERGGRGEKFRFHGGRQEHKMMRGHHGMMREERGMRKENRQMMRGHYSMKEEGRSMMRENRGMREEGRPMMREGRGMRGEGRPMMRENKERGVGMGRGKMMGQPPANFKETEGERKNLHNEKNIGPRGNQFQGRKMFRGQMMKQDLEKVHQDVNTLEK